MENSTWYLRDKENNTKVFNSGGKLTQIRSNQTNDKIMLSYNANGFLQTVTDGGGKTITIGRNINNAVTSITNYLGTTTFNYIGSKLVRITYQDGQYIAMSYYDDGKFRIMDKRDGTSIYYEYNSVGDAANKNRVSRVTERSDYRTEGGREDGNYVGFVYDNGNFTKVTDKQGRSVIYNFDNLGRTTSSVDETGAASTSYIGKNNNSSNYNKIASDGGGALPVNNLLLNHNFEAEVGTENWYTFNSDGASHATSVLMNHYIGSKCIQLTSASTVLNSTFYQSYNVNKAGKYTFSFYYKIDHNLVGTGGIRAILGLKNSSGTNANYVNGACFKNSTGDWVRTSVTADVSSSITKINAIVQLQNVTGTVYVDCAQLEYANAANDYNLVQNSCFERDVNGWEHNGITGDGVKAISSTSFFANKPQILNNGYLVKGSTDANRYVRQDIRINKLASLTAFRFSGYACGNSVPKKDPNLLRYMSLDMCINFTDGTKEYHVVDFNYNTTTWQYASDVIVPSQANLGKTVSYIKVFFCIT